MIAALPMYDWPEERAAVDALWSALAEALRDAGFDAPATLCRDRMAAEAWTDPALLLGQSCGLPYRAGLHHRVSLVGAFDHRLPGAAPGHYYSQLVVRADDPRTTLAQFGGATLALNGFDSQSGWAAPQAQARAAGVGFGDALVTGAHRDSARTVAEGRADLAALDAVTWRLFQRYEPGATARLRVLAATEPTPALPLIAAAGQPAGALRQALAEALARLSQELRDRLSVHGVVAVPRAAYLAVPLPPAGLPG